MSKTSKPRLILWLYASGFLVAAMIVAGTILMLANLREQQLSETSRELQNLALTVGKQINGNFNAVELVEKSLSDPLEALDLTTSAEFARRVSGEGVHLTLKDKISGLPFISALAFVSAEGKLLTSSFAWPAPVVDVTDRDYFNALISDPQLTSFIGRPVRNRVIGTWAIHALRAVRGSNHQLLGLVLATLELKYFEKSFADITLLRGGSIALLREDGVLFARYPRIEDTVGQRYTALLAKLGKDDQRVSRLVSRIDMQDRIVAAQRLAQYPLVVAVGVETQAALAAWRGSALSILAAAGALMVVIAAIIFAGANRVATRLRTQNMQFDSAINNMSQGLCVFDRGQRLIVSNDQYARMYALSPAQVRPGTTLGQLLECRRSRGTFVKDLKPQTYLDETLPFIEQKSGGSRVTELSDGRFIVVVTRPMVDGGWVTTHEDITALSQREDALRTQNLLFDAALNNMAQGFIMLDRDERVLVCNELYIKMYGLSRDVVKPGCSLTELLRHRADRGHLLRDPGGYRLELLADIRKGKRSCFIAPTGDGRYISVTNQPMTNGGWLSSHEDITERRKADAQISHMALHDALTNLPNRLLFREQIEGRLAHLPEDQQFAVLCLDLDGFKRVNDTLGHSFGDELLRQVATRMSGCLHEGDTLARLGGDEFAILQGNIKQPNDSLILAACVFDAASAPFDLDGQQVVIGVSIGIAVAPTDAADPDDLLKNADMALYRAKAEGRGTYRFFEPEMDALMQARRALELDLRKALANAEFELYYQPIVNLEHQEISGFEGLIRWNHPERGIVAPVEFIALAEETALIVPIGEWALRQACSEAMKWPSDIGVAVNLSPVQFRMRSLPQVVMNALAHSGLSANRLDLEITESVLLEENERTLEILHQLRSLGVRISMDDFGIGYSSLSYLQSFPFDKIKIDRSFVHNLTSNPDSRAIIRAVAGLGSSLRMSTTGEGVETHEELDYLKAQGITEAQGYLFGTPIRAREIPEMLSKQLATKAVA